MYFRVATNAKHCYVCLITEHNVLYTDIHAYSDYSSLVLILCKLVIKEVPTPIFRNIGIFT